MMTDILIFTFLFPPAIADPDNRDSVYGAYQTYAEFGKFRFDYSAENIIRIEPVRNQPEFELISISDTDYTTDVSEKVFLITYSMSDDITSFRADFSSNDTMYVKDVNFVGDEDTVYILAPNVKIGDEVSVDTVGQNLESTLTVTAYNGYVKIYRTLTGGAFTIKKRMPLYIIKP